MDHDVRATQRLRDLSQQRRTAEGAAAAALVPLLTDYLDDVSRRTEQRLDDVAGVAVTLSVDGEPWTVGASTVLAAEVDLIQYEVGVGPCLLALQRGVETYAPDLASDDRWESYGPRAAAHGAASCVSIPVVVDEQPAAVIKVYSAQVDGLSAEDRDIARSVAAEVAGGIRLSITLGEQAQLLDDREEAMHTRRAIDLALGILMERTHCGAGQAFSLLRSLSQNRNLKLRDAARHVLGSVPGTIDSDAQAPFSRRETHLSAPANQGPR